MNNNLQAINAKLEKIENTKSIIFINNIFIIQYILLLLLNRIKFIQNIIFK